MCVCVYIYIYMYVCMYLDSYSYLSFWFLPHLSSQPHASWELTVLFGKLSKSFKTVFKSCNSTFVLLQLRTCQASSAHLDFSSAKRSKISILCMKSPVFCMGIYTSQPPLHLAGCAWLFLEMGNWVLRKRRLLA